MTFLRENTHKTLHNTNCLHCAGWSGLGPDDPGLGFCERLEGPGRMIRPYTGWSGLGKFKYVFSLFCHYPGWSGNHQKTHNVTFGGGSIYTPSPPFIYSSLSPDQPASKTLNPPLLSILQLDSCKETPRYWEEVRFEVWFESTPWASTCSS